MSVKLAVMNVNVIAFRKDMQQPPVRFGEVSDIIPVENELGVKVDCVNGGIYVKFTVLGMTQELFEQLKNKEKRFQISPEDPKYNSLLSGTLVVDLETAMSYTVDS